MKNNDTSRGICLQIVLIIIICCTLITTGYGESKLKTISDKLYMISGYGGNVAFLVTDKSILVVDGGYTPSNGKQILDEIRTVSDKPIEYIVLTHYHPDHVRGVQELLGSAEVFAQENLANNLATLGYDRLKNDIENRYPEYIAGLKEEISNYIENEETSLAELNEAVITTESQLTELKTINLVTPDNTFSDSLAIEIGDEEIILYYLGSGHTSGNTIVYFKNHKTIHLGDLFFHGTYPYIDFEAGSNTENWINILKRVSSWDIEHVIPGHGEISDRESINEQIQYLVDLREAVSQAIIMGKSLEKIKEETKLDGYDDFNWPYYLPIGIEAVYN
ncbi:MAG: MBL fold metallo-hydrolase, partial [Candidatus Marinimicrobia bacterium]|nr:MBL fold metallo-hydrolase [Candidatus Neomarinimicrobiota bacterium]